MLIINAGSLTVAGPLKEKKHHSFSVSEVLKFLLSFLVCFWPTQTSQCHTSSGGGWGCTRKVQPHFRIPHKCAVVSHYFIWFYALKLQIISFGTLFAELKKFVDYHPTDFILYSPRWKMDQHTKKRSFLQCLLTDAAFAFCMFTVTAGQIVNGTTVTAFSSNDVFTALRVQLQRPVQKG